MTHQRGTQELCTRLIIPIVAAASLHLSTQEPALAGAPDRTSASSEIRGDVATTAGQSATTSTALRARSAGWRIKVAGWTQPFRRGGQARIDRCQATLWWGSTPGKGGPTTWLAGHNHCGFWRWDRHLPVGANFVVRGPDSTKYSYRVTSRRGINRQSGSARGLIRGDLMLQTCRGSSTQFVYAKLISVR